MLKTYSTFRVNNESLFWFAKGFKGGHGWGQGSMGKVKGDTSWEK